VDTKKSGHSHSKSRTFSIFGLKINKVLAVGITVAILVNLTVVMVGFGYLQNEINQLKLDTDNTQPAPEQTEQQPTSQPPQTPSTPSTTNNEPTQTTSTETPKETSTPPQTTISEGKSANLIIENTRMRFVTDGGLRLVVSGTISNTGEETARTVKLHIQTWFPDGKKGIDTTVTLNKEIYFIIPAKPVNIAGGESYTLTSRWFSGTVVSVPGQYWLDEWGKVYPYDLISSYEVTPIWE